MCHPYILAIRKNLVFQDTVVICKPGDQNNPFKVMDCQPAGQESISQMDPGDLGLRHI